jgi:5,10-methylenetetrahydromethanopterin reductase
VKRLTFHLGLPSPSIADVHTAEWADIAGQAEKLGFDCLWHSNERFYREMLVRMTVSTLATTRLQIGGAIAEPYAVHPAVTAQALATLHELSAGRATIALGAGGSGFPMMGIERRRPAATLRDACRIVRGMLAGESVTLAGAVPARDAHLHFTPPSPPAPVWVATRGDQTLQVAGAVADGALVATYARPRDIAGAVEIVHEGARSAERDPNDLRVMSRVDTCVHADRATAYAGSRLMVAKLLWTSYPDRNFVRRAGLQVPPDLEEVIARRDYDALHSVSDAVPDELVAAFCWAGTPADVARHVVDVVRETGIAEIGFWVLRAPGQSVTEAIRLVAGEVVPVVRAELRPQAQLEAAG